MGEETIQERYAREKAIYDAYMYWAWADCIRKMSDDTTTLEKKRRWIGEMDDDKKQSVMEKKDAVDYDMETQKNLLKLLKLIKEGEKVTA